MTNHSPSRKRPLFAFLVAAVLCTTATAWADVADDELERENLVQLANELERLKAQVAQAERTAPTVQRVKFRYDWLQRDLELVRQAVLTHADAARQPRPVVPLRGDYRN